MNSISSMRRTREQENTIKNKARKWNGQKEKKKKKRERPQHNINLWQCAMCNIKFRKGKIPKQKKKRKKKDPRTTMH